MGQKSLCLWNKESVKNLKTLRLVDDSKQNPSPMVHVTWVSSLAACGTV